MSVLCTCVNNFQFWGKIRDYFWDHNTFPQHFRNQIFEFCVHQPIEHQCRQCQHYLHPKKSKNNYSALHENSVQSKLALQKYTTRTITIAKPVRKAAKMSLKEDHPLLNPVLSDKNPFRDLENAESRAEASRLSAELYRNFITMAISFSINHGNKVIM